jgi:arginyl-tRNA synthetase
MSDQHRNIFATVLGRVHAALAALSAAGALPALDPARVVVEPPRDPSHGDMATNAAMVLAKEAGKKPRDLAELIAEKLRADDLIAKVDVAGPGFINLALKANVWAGTLRAAIAADTDYGRGVSDGHKVNVEYVSANPTGPIHLGHTRWAVLSRGLLETRRRGARERARRRSCANVGRAVAPARARQGHRRDDGDDPR